jgi:hypothetical protein
MIADHVAGAFGVLVESGNDDNGDNAQHYYLLVMNKRGRGV